MTEHPLYRPSFERHLHNLVVNGFYTRELDADDFAFLEYVRARGVANGSLPCTDVVLLEELGFWHLPYTIAPGIERRVGRGPRAAESAERREWRQARQDARRAQRLIREQERAQADAELEREQREWEAEQAKRKIQQALADAEWEAAAPKLAFGRTIRRHYVPQWKFDEKHREKSARRSPGRAKFERLRRDMDAKAKALAEEQARRRQVIEEARQTVARLKQLDKASMPAARTIDELMQNILTLLNSTPGRPWSREGLLRALGDVDERTVDGCLQEMARRRAVQKVSMP